MHKVEVLRSRRRKKTVSASLVDGVIRVHVPAHMNPDDEQAAVDEIVEKVRHKLTSQDIDLGQRATALASDYGLARPTEINWTSRQTTRWGSCTPVNGSVRISDRVAAMPDWVLDYVIVHELAHLRHHGHGTAFEAEVNRYPLAERARGYLLAVNQIGGATRAAF